MFASSCMCFRVGLFSVSSSLSKGDPRAVLWSFCFSAPNFCTKLVLLLSFPDFEAEEDIL